MCDSLFFLSFSLIFPLSVFGIFIPHKLGGRGSAFLCYRIRSSFRSKASDNHLDNSILSFRWPLGRLDMLLLSGGLWVALIYSSFIIHLYQLICRSHRRVRVRLLVNFWQQYFPAVTQNWNPENTVKNCTKNSFLSEHYICMILDSFLGADHESQLRFC